MKWWDTIFKRNVDHSKEKKPQSHDKSHEVVPLLEKQTTADSFTNDSLKVNKEVIESVRLLYQQILVLADTAGGDPWTIMPELRPLLEELAFRGGQEAEGLLTEIMHGPHHMMDLHDLCSLLLNRIKSGDISKYSRGSDSDILTAAKAGNVNEVMGMLIANPQLIEHRDVYDYTPLALAASSGYSGLVEALIVSGANINTTTRGGFTPLILAASKGYTDIVALLLERGADVNSHWSDGGTALTEAASKGYKDIVLLLLGKGAEVNTKDDSGRSPLLRAVHAESPELVRLLIAAGADVNCSSDGVTPLHCAHSAELVDILIVNGADIHAKNKSGETPLHFVASYGTSAAVKTLLEHGANINARDSLGKTPLHSAACSSAGIEVARLLIEHGAEVNARTSDQNGRTPLWFARTFNKPLAQFLKEHGGSE